MYNDFNGILPIAKKFHHSGKTIRKILTENNVHIRNHEESTRVKYKVNDNFFDINNQGYNMAYVMGLIASDGCIHSKDNLIFIELKSDDKELLEKVRIALQCEREIKTYYRKDKDLETSKIYFYSKKIKEDLAKFNIVPNKTYSDLYHPPYLLDKKYIPAFIRGMFDGDGSIYTTKGHSSWQIDSSSEEMINWINDFFKEKGMTFNHDYNQKTKVILSRSITSRKDYLLKIFNILYNNPEEKNPIYLERKYEKFKNLIMK